MLTLYYAAGTCARASLIALAEAGADYTIVPLDFGQAEQRKPEYLAVNPKGRVPALATGRGVLTETPAVLAFIAQSFPAARLAPLDDPFAFAQMQAFNAYLSSTVHPHHAHNRRGARWSDDPAVIENLKLKVPQNMTDCFTIIENDYLKGPWVMGEQYTVADAYLFTISGWLAGDGVDINKFPKVLAQREAMLKRPAVIAAMEKHEA